MANKIEPLEQQLELLDRYRRTIPRVLENDELLDKWGRLIIVQADWFADRIEAAQLEGRHAVRAEDMREIDDFLTAVEDDFLTAAEAA